ncbi:MAG: tetratricopeptide repeat protein [Flavobacteriales bacterium]|jgi:tetratricopeptide (TPR) repeat protein|tara:strand:+ start:13313 stop:13999 length:687 start_codon:yes stop_codon:yes gene_type:complete
MAENKNQNQEDQLKTIEESLTKAEMYVEKNKNNLMVIVVAIAVGFSAFFGYDRFYVQPNEENAATEMYMAEKNFELGKFQEALDGDEQFAGLLEIIESYGSTNSGNLAEYYAGLSYLKLGDAEAAIEHLDNFSSEDEMLAPIAKGAIGDAFSELGQNEEALNYYITAAELRTNDFTTPVFLMKAANAAYSLGNKEQALSLYTRIQDEFASTREGQNIGKYISRITAAN